MPVLTIITLCHELAHAYTHRGVDLNNNAWNTERFLQTDVWVKEGLAQYYTDQVMRGLEARLPGIRDSFSSLSGHQSALYTEYRNWIPHGAGPSLETVRYAMLEFRNDDGGARDHGSFVGIVRRAHQILGATQLAAARPARQMTLFEC